MKPNDHLIAHESQEDYSHRPDGSRGLRFLAYVFDTILYSALTVFAVAVGTRLIGSGLVGLALQILIFFLYFPYLTQKHGGTPGKVLFKLRVVNSHGQTPTFGSLVGRETIGKLISGAFFMIGYIVILFSKPRLGWHDRIFGTRVVSLAESGSFNIARNLATACGVLILFGVGVYYSFLHSSWPLQVLKSRLEVAGFQVGEITGSIKKGAHISHLSYENEKGTLEIKDLRFDVNQIINSKKSNEFVVDKLVIASLKIRLKEGVRSLAKKEKKLPEKEKTEEPTLQQDRPKLREESAEPLVVALNLIDVQNIELESPELKQPFRIQRFYIDKLLFKEGKLDITRFYLDGPMAKLDVAEFGFENRKPYLKKPVYLTLKPELSPELLKKEIGLVVQIHRFESLQSMKATFSAMQNKLSISVDGLQVSAVLRDFTPAEYFHSDIPIKVEHLQAKSKNIMMAALMGQFEEFSGAGMWGPQRLTFYSGMSTQDPICKGLCGDLQLNGQWLALEMVPRTKPGEKKLSLGFVLHQKTAARMSIEDTLSQLNFGKNVADLSSEEAQMQVKYSELVMPMASDRAPASILHKAAAPQ